MVLSYGIFYFVTQYNFAQLKIAKYTNIPPKTHTFFTKTTLAQSGTEQLNEEEKPTITSR